MVLECPAVQPERYALNQTPNLHDTVLIILVLPAAVHQLDIQSRSQLKRFCEEDSNALENAYRQRAEELEKAWWNEQAELSSGPAAAGKGAVPEEETASTQWQVSMTLMTYTSSICC